MQGYTIRSLSPEIEQDGLDLVNTYTSGWPYTRPVDRELFSYWKTLGGAYQPENMLVLYDAHNRPVAFLHGQQNATNYTVHILAIADGAVDAGETLLREAESRACAAGVTTFTGPGPASRPFYGGFVLGSEPCHPHWATEGTQAYIQAGYRVWISSVLMSTDLARVREPGECPAGYRVRELESDQEYLAHKFGVGMFCNDKQIAYVFARQYPDVTGLRGESVGQIGGVGTDEEHRGRGIAKHLTAVALQRLRAMGCGEALIATSLDNCPALRAYENAGFRRRHFICIWSKDVG